MVLWAERRDLVARGLPPARFLPKAPEHPLRSLSAAQQEAVVAVEDLVAEIRLHVGKLVPFEGKDVSWFNRAVRLRSGVDAFSAHACRHTFGFNYMARGGNILALKEPMGHSTVELTAHYAKPSQELVRADAERVWSREA